MLPEPVRRFFSRTFSLLVKEEAALEELHAEAKATVRRMTEEDPGLKARLENAHAYAVFPSVGKATAVIGGAYGKGEVFQGDQLVGYAGLAQLTLGVQVGGQTFSEIVILRDKAALERFKAGRTAFAANASGVLVKAGAAATTDYDSGAMVFVSPEGGMMLEAAIGVQKFVFRPAALGRTKSTPRPGKSAEERTGKGKPAPSATDRTKQGAAPARVKSKRNRSTGMTPAAGKSRAGTSGSQQSSTKRRSPSPRRGRAD